ncbi:MAG: AP2 domain-containing protein [Bacteroidetes bacterium]|nr:AP2 domain-containing protein [Bacteroidota bacterium]
MSSKTIIPDLHHIRKYERAWMFQIRPGKGQPTHTKNFSFKKFGGVDKALKVAIAYRDKFIADNNIELTDRFSKSEIPGVSLTYEKRKNGNKAQVWQAIGYYNNRQNTRRFHVNKYGFEEAKQMAIEAKQQMDKEAETGIPSLFEEPADSSVKIWRYMDFTKFVYMLEKGALFFPQVDDLGDPYEGELSNANRKIRNFVYARAKNKSALGSLTKEIRRRRPNIFVNCWHMNKNESAAMWRLYAKSNEAICIQTTFSKYKRALPDIVKLGMVKYIDYEKDWIPESDIYFPFIYKRNSFEHEHELRGLIDTTELTDTNNENIEVVKKGVWIKVNLNHFLENIYVAPDSPDWFKTLVEKVKDKYKLTRKKVQKSPLHYRPQDQI